MVQYKHEELTLHSDALTDVALQLPVCNAHRNSLSDLFLLHHPRHHRLPLNAAERIAEKVERQKPGVWPT